MPNATGTANTPSELMQAINTLVTANGWTKLRGETDNVCVSPKAARYWRLLWIENEDTGNDFRELTTMQFRTTLGGAAIAGTWSSKGINTGVLPGLFRTADINDDFWWIKLDCGSATIVREVMIQCQTDNEAPRDFLIQWSNDDLCWTTMFRTNGLSWVDNETKVFQFDDGYLDSIHSLGTEARRVGFDVRNLTTNYAFTSPYVDACDDRFVWQAPGYDANRRVYIECRGHSNLTDSTNYLQFGLSPEYDLAEDTLGLQEGGYSDVLHIFDINPVDYWIYMNSTRLIVITKSGVDDYTSTYIGMLGAFADPDNYPHPLFMSSTSYQFDAYNVTDNRLSSMADPGDNAAVVRLWDNTWNFVENRLSSGITNLYKENPVIWVWPYHSGGTDRGNWPFTWIGDYVDFDNHFLNQQDPTDQGDIPLYPAVVQSEIYGNIGALTGVFVVPGGTLVPEQVFTISAVNYRAFPNRDRRDGCNWFVVRED
jgi:hypothetical protein